MSATSVDVGGTTDLNGGAVTTAGGQTYTGAATLSAAVTLKDTNDGAIFFGGSVTGNTFALASQTTGLTTFDPAVMGLGALNITGDAAFGASVSAVSVNVGGTTDLNGGTVTTTNGQTYTGAVTLSAAAMLIDTGGSAITFGSTVTGATFALTTQTTGLTTFDAAVSGVGSLSVTGNAVFDGSVGATSVSVGGTSDLNGGTITTAGGQTYTGAVTLSAAAILKDTASAAITFDSTVTGNTFALTTQTTGLTTFDAAVTGVGALSVTGNAVFDGGKCGFRERGRHERSQRRHGYHGGWPDLYRCGYLVRCYCSQGHRCRRDHLRLDSHRKYL